MNQQKTLWLELEEFIIMQYIRQKDSKLMDYKKGINTKNPYQLSSKGS